MNSPNTCADDADAGPVSSEGAVPQGAAIAPGADGPLTDRLGYLFRDPVLLRLALTHPSVTHDLGATAPHNQRLEFLGDAVLQLVLTHELYEKFPELGEGPLTQARAEMVNRRTLANQSRELALGEFLVMSRAEEQNGGRERPSALADAFEALIGALFLDGGLEAARAFILGRFHQAFGELEALPSLHNPKGELQELLQAGSTDAPLYHLVAVSGPDHDRLFVCAVTHRGEELGRGSGKTKKAAETEAAHRALEFLRQRVLGSAAAPPGLDEPLPEPPQPEPNPAALPDRPA